MSVLQSTSYSPASTILMAPRARIKSHSVIQQPQLQLPKNLKEVLQNFIQRNDITSYEDLVCIVKECEIHDEELQLLLSNCREIISLMDKNLHHFVEVLLAIKWYKRGDSVAQEYQDFLIDLLSAHNYYMDLALENLVGSFKAVTDEEEWTDGKPTEIEERCFRNVHDVLQAVLKIVPMSCKILLKSIVNNFPYFKRSAHIHEAYIYNMLKVFDYRMDLRLELLLILVNRLVCLDVNAPKNEIEKFENKELNSMDVDLDVEPEVFSMEESETERKALPSPAKLAHPIANTLDTVLTQVFKYIDKVCYGRSDLAQLDWLSTKCLYRDMLTVFERLILPTYDVHHVQFILYYMCSLNVTLAESFLNYLWLKVSSPHEAPVVRQSAVLYIASLLARATFIPILILKNVVSKIALWIHNYISTQDGLENANSDVRVHGVFFSVCQALFYVIAFRHRDLVSTRKNLTYLQSLNFTKIVTCRLNPLRVCIPPVVQNFAAVTRAYQLAYCYTIIEHNSRNTIPVIHHDGLGTTNRSASECLETFFPFDPYLLVRSGDKISPIYREYQGDKVIIDDASMNTAMVSVRKEEDDDFLTDPLSSSFSIISPDVFSYGSSPGFKHKP